MEQNSKEKIIAKAIYDLEEHWNEITHSSVIYGEFIYDSFERLLTLLSASEKGFVVERIYVLLSRESNRAACYIDGYSSNGAHVENLADGRHNSSDVMFSRQASKIADNLDYLHFSEIESAWEILYNKVLPKEVHVDIIYDFIPPYESYKVAMKPGEQVSAIIVYFDSNM